MQDLTVISPSKSIWALTYLARNDFTPFSLMRVIISVLVALLVLLLLFLMVLMIVLFLFGVVIFDGNFDDQRLHIVLIWNFFENVNFVRHFNFFENWNFDLFDNFHFLDVMMVNCVDTLRCLVMNMMWRFVFLFVLLVTVIISTKFMAVIDFGVFFAIEMVLFEMMIAAVLKKMILIVAEALEMFAKAVMSEMFVLVEMEARVIGGVIMV